MECSERERDLRVGHDPSCSRYVQRCCTCGHLEEDHDEEGECQTCGCVYFTEQTDSHKQ